MTVLQRHVALPGDHGSWAFFLSPLIIGLFAGGTWKVTSLYLIVAALCGFLIRQPLTLTAKVWSGRRSRDTLPAALFWIGVYGAVAALHVLGLVLRGFGYLLYLAIPGVAVFGWYLYLVSRREERHQWFMEILATGVMALIAPAGMWVGLGFADPLGWALWTLVWIQSATSVLYVHSRLAQRTLPRAPEPLARLKLAGPALTLASLALIGVAESGLAGRLPGWLWVPYGVQWIEVAWGVLSPATGLKPKAIGYRQLAVSTLFTVLFVLAWRA